MRRFLKEISEVGLFIAGMVIFVLVIFFLLFYTIYTINGLLTRGMQ